MYIISLNGSRRHILHICINSLACEIILLFSSAQYFVLLIWRSIIEWLYIYSRVWVRWRTLCRKQASRPWERRGRRPRRRLAGQWAWCCGACRCWRAAAGWSYPRTAASTICPSSRSSIWIKKGMIRKIKEIRCKIRSKIARQLYPCSLTHIKCINKLRLTKEGLSFTKYKYNIYKKFKIVLFSFYPPFK